MDVRASVCMLVPNALYRFQVYLSSSRNTFFVCVLFKRICVYRLNEKYSS